AQRRDAATLEGLVSKVLCHDVRDAAAKIAVEKGARLTVATAKVLLETPWEEIHLLGVEPTDLHEEEAGKRLAAAVVGAGVDAKQRARFEAALKQKIEWFGGRLLPITYAGGSPTIVVDALTALRREGAEVLIVAGASALDPLDPVFGGLTLLGARMERHGA